ncbi:MAG: sulfurtransferase [gamma proteobacterium symbiont of Bathyaustriella thionipta]|nr:sulfurtransferase [gamma proteobacterium symbiont of Bathyaustriella thionipta]MCU7949131.1 sulfurtransferase [gamma proteobacterium symbiont of Bathyaustriella thionipta]MCU7952250.1 sulfurtransferase [gamma proteobacterium symbiont of Bathyaustriella thionipta]MCU7955800.1 sulfurtransferase [gamma proteobacterium symbiont of Bathyaustriella thionipta]MCU7968032.1 sulfurtransferase [gamma proteobacterium symbiont of Bathyaustriella thionipta]
MREMSPQQVNNYLLDNATKPLLLDVREPWEYNICRIEGSQLMPMQSIPAHLNKLDPQQEIIVICHHGVRSRMVAQFLEQAQFEKVINLSGGVNSWAQSVDLDMPRY